ncbi:YcgJ family protein [Enterobacter ludwigii]|uniref:YcgJ family protein n=1 Tax=Enterobacter ludwigii TaxID=299767 RepID=UPI00242F7552|nr:YcgJ family protein [Enterobacter ludwigii]WGA03937.1 YcgJ family protein [Enterobacter ludwigii]
MLNIPRHHIVPLCLCLLGAVSTARAVLNHHAGVFEPDAGVVCDRHSGFCADAQGHEDAFSLSDGRRCERSAQTCWRGLDHAVPDTGLTRHLYGSGI